MKKLFLLIILVAVVALTAVSCNKYCNCKATVSGYGTAFEGRVPIRAGGVSSPYKTCKQLQKAANDDARANGAKENIWKCN